MISSNTRASRSRYSSPAQTQSQQNGGNWNGSGNGNPLDSSGDTSRAFMQKWLEPSVQTKTSFEEAGLIRYGVLENMAPLGTMPKPKKPGENGHPVRRIVLRPSGSGIATAANAARESTPKTPAATTASSPPPAKTSAEVPAVSTPATAPPQRKALPTKTREDDDEYDPKGISRRRKLRRASGSAAAADSTTTTSAPASASGLSKRPRRSSGAGVRKRSISMSASKPVARRSSSSFMHLEPGDREFTDKVIEAAVDEALDLYRYPTAWALRTLYDENAGDHEFAAMIEDVFHQTADAPTLEKFRSMIEDKKREGKKDNQGCYYFVPPATNSRFTPHKPKPAPYAKLLHPQPVADEVEPPRAIKKIKLSHAAAATTPRKTAAHANGVHGSGRMSSRKRARRGSHSSDSSLSSAVSLSSPEASVESLSPSFRGGGAGGAKPSDAPKSGPIKTRGKSLSSKQAAPIASESTSPTHPSHTKRPVDASMPGRISVSDLYPSLPSKTITLPKDEIDTLSGLPPHVPEREGVEDDDVFWDRRRDARKVSNGYSAFASSVRGGSEMDTEQAATPARGTRKTRQSLLLPASTRATRSASKRPNEDTDGALSPASPSVQGDGSSAVGSRAATPSALRASKKPRTGLRIKSSPMKKKGGTAAGVPRSTGEAHASVTNGTAKDQAADNDEYCSACGNTGDVVCCDGCPRSFHFECVDMDASESLPDEWYCNECLIKRWPSRVPVHKGSFAGPLNNLEKSIPRAFSLPKRLQNRFEGVRAGADGDYEEVNSNKLAKKKNGYDELPDFFKQREDGQAVLCHICQKPATDVRAIIPCSACPLHWHIDCLEPPLAVPPVLKTWRCPAHIDDVLGEAPLLAPAHRFRRVKGSQMITPAITRGVKNNGHVEIDWTDEPEEPNGSSWPDPASFGRTYKLPVRSVVLDFIEQLRRQGAGYGTHTEEPRGVSQLVAPFHRPDVSLRGSDLHRTIEEMQLSLNLTSLKQSPTQGIDQLTAALLAGADENVLSLMAQTNAASLTAGQLTDGDKQGLRAMLSQMDAMGSRIREILVEGGQADASPRASLPAEALSTAKPSPTPEAQVAAVEALPPVEEPAAMETTPAPETPAADHAPNKQGLTAPVAEPTPPSTVDQTEGIMDVD